MNNYTEKDIEQLKTDLLNALSLLPPAVQEELIAKAKERHKARLDQEASQR